MKNDHVNLVRDCPATVIPAGEEVTLPEGGRYDVAQKLGGSVTLRDATGMYRVAARDLDALGEELKIAVEADAVVTAARTDKAFDEESVWDALRTCYDPEIPVNIVDLGLIYDLQMEDIGEGRHKVAVLMTLTAQGCGMGPAIAADAQTRIEMIPQVDSAQVEIVWDPPWNPRMISDEAKKTLGL